MQETRETRVQSLGQEDLLEEGTATHSSILAGRTLWTEEPGGLQSIGSQRVGHDWSDLAQHSTHNPHKSFWLLLLLLLRYFSRVRLFATPWTVACQAPLFMGILQARTLEWVAIPFSRGSSQPRDWTQFSILQVGSLPSEPPVKHPIRYVSYISAQRTHFFTPALINTLYCPTSILTDTMAENFSHHHFYLHFPDYQWGWSS